MKISWKIKEVGMCHLADYHAQFYVFTVSQNKMSKSYVNINVKEGKNLVSKDSNGFSDPYVKVNIPSTYPAGKSLANKSAVIKATLNPKWGFIVSGYEGVTSDKLATLSPVKVKTTILTQYSLLN